MRRRRARSVVALGAAVLAGIAATLGLPGCADDGRAIVRSGPGGRDPAAVAASNGFATGQAMMDGLTPDGPGLEVSYFEPMRRGDWVAPDHCWFPTRVTVGSQATEGFRGPRSDDDRGVGEGVVYGALRLLVDAGPSTPSDSGPDAPTTQPAEPTEATEPTEPAEPAEPATTLPDGSPTTQPAEPSSPATSPTVPSDPGGPVPVSGLRTAVVVFAAAFGHDQVVELSTDDPAAMQGHSLDTAPADGWSLLTIQLDEQALEDTTTSVRLRRVGRDGTSRTEDLGVDTGADGISVLPATWHFDVDRVDDACVPPEGESTNEAPTPESDLLGSPINDAPVLPAPGEQPDDPTAATAEAVAALTALYDLDDTYASSKRDLIENPEDFDRMRADLLADDVLAPYMSKLDPVFRNSVFVSPTEVHVLYRVGPTYQWEIGRVLLIDGRWRVAAGTVCRDLDAALYQCPGVRLDPPPGPLG